MIIIIGNDDNKNDDDNANDNDNDDNDNDNDDDALQFFGAKQTLQSKSALSH